jgi:hypothetical protein
VSKNLWNYVTWISIVGVLSMMSACGSGQSGTGGTNAPDFTLSVSPGSLTLQPGTGGTVQVTLTPVNSFSGTAQVQVQNLPSGVTLSATQFSVSASSPQNVNVATDSSVAAGNYSFAFQGSSGSLSHSATLTVSVNVGNSSPSRADFVPTYDTPESATYDMARKLVYVSNPIRGTVDVVSSTTNNVLKRIPIPSPRGLEISIDGSKIYVGTNTQALYVIDATTQRLSQRYFTPAPMGGFIAWEPQKLVQSANGKLIVLGLSNGTYQIATWDLTTNTYQVRTDAPFGFDNTGVLARSGDGTKVIIANDVSSGEVTLYDSATDLFRSTAGLPFPFAVAANANGTQFAAAASDQIYVFDAQLNLLHTLPASTPVQYSPDGSKLYVVGFLGTLPVVEIFDMQTFSLIGMSPSYSSGIAYFSQDPPFIQEKPLVADETGRLFGAADHGLAIDDTTDLHSYTGKEFPTDAIPVMYPAEGPPDVRQVVKLPETQNLQTPPSIWFGGVLASGTQEDLENITTTTPGLAATGPVNVRFIDTNHVQSFIPQAYSYGSSLISNPDLAASSSGGGYLSVFGYGLGALTAQGGPVTTRVTAGNTSAQLLTSKPVAEEEPYPLAMTHVQFQPPAVSTGAYDLTVSSAAGNATFKGGYHALPITSYPLDGQGVSIVYDHRRNQVYVSTATHVDVFSLTSLAFLQTIAIPALNGLFQLGGMALSPDGSKLLVTNWADGSVVIVNPDDLSTKTVAVTTPANSNPWVQGPQAIAVGNNGKALISVASAPSGSPSNQRGSGAKKRSRAVKSTSTPFANLWELDMTTLTVTPSVFASAGIGGPLSLESTDDGSKICLAGEDRHLSMYDSASDTFHLGPEQGGSGDCAVSGTVAVAGGTPFGRPSMLDVALNFNGFAPLTDYTQTSMNTEANVTGLLLDPQGAILYQPFTQEILLYDAHTGQLLERIAMPTNVERISNGALARDATGLQIFALTDSGLTVVQLDNLPLAIGHITSQGGTWTISGTGFVQGTGVSVDGASLNVNFVSGQSLNITAAPDLSSVEEITLTNPNGRSYIVPAAYVR